MSDNLQDGKTLALMVLLALWAAAWGYSLVPLFHAPSDEGLARGMTRAKGFFGWQAIAGMIALALWGIGRSFPKRSGIRRVSGIPFAMALALIIFLVSASIFSPTNS